MLAFFRAFKRGKSIKDYPSILVAFKVINENADGTLLSQNPLIAFPFL